jgi:hypothetical protein
VIYNPFSDYAVFLFIFGGPPVVLGLLAYFVFDHVRSRRRAKRDREEMATYIEQQHQINPVVIDWRPTGRINMCCADPHIMIGSDRELEPADFMLLIEEKRLVADISGAPTLQTQWRKASRRDARHTVKLYNERALEVGPGEKLEEHATAPAVYQRLLEQARAQVDRVGEYHAEYRHAAVSLRGDGSAVDQEVTS